MNNGKACAIFRDIKNENYTTDEKAWAIHQVLSMPTHNSITKANMIEVLCWLWHQHWEIAGAVDLLGESDYEV